MVRNRKFMKETCSQSDWRPACPEEHSNLYLVEFVSANVVWFSSSWILNRMCNFTISYFQNNIFLDYKLLRYTAQASAIRVFISGDENSSRKYILSEYVHVARWGWKTRISDNFTVLKWEDFFETGAKSYVFCHTTPNFNPTPIPPPALRRLNGYMAFPGFLYCLNEADLISNFPLNMQRAIFTLKITNLYLTYFLLFFFELKCTEFFVITTI